MLIRMHKAINNKLKASILPIYFKLKFHISKIKLKIFKIVHNSEYDVIIIRIMYSI